MLIKRKSLLAYQSLDDIVIRGNNKNYTFRQLLKDILYLDQKLPHHAYFLNLYENRYYFLLVMLLGIKRNSTHLFPSNITNYTINFLENSYPDILVLNNNKIPLAKSEFIDIEELLKKRGKDSNYSDKKLANYSDELFSLSSFDDKKIIIFTSGSTGDPKPYKKVWNDFIDVANQLQLKLKLKKQSMILATVPAQHMYGLEVSIVFPLVNGFSIYSERPFYPADISTVLNQQKQATVLVTTPLHLRACLKTQVDLPFLKYTLSATAPLDENMAKDFEILYNTNLHEIYGCTEVGVIAMKQPSKNKYWQCLNDISIDFLNNEPCILTTRSIQRFVLNDYISNFDNNSFLLKGRKEDIINIAGKRTSLSYLNYHLLNLSYIQDASFYQTEINDNKHQRLVAFIVLEVKDIPLSNIKSDLSTKIDSVFLPRKFFIIDRIPRNKTGKIMLNELKSLYKKVKL